jgi:transposase-like protein
MKKTSKKKQDKSSEPQRRLVGMIREPDQCPHCRHSNFVKRGSRKKKREVVQLYLCRQCQRTFSRQSLKGRHYPTRVILEGVSLYHRGFSGQVVAKRLARRYSLDGLDRTTVYQWAAKLSPLCPFARLRAKVIDRYPPEKMILETTLRHKQMYRYRFHRAKAEMQLSFREHRRFHSLAAYLENAPWAYEDEASSNGLRASQLKSAFGKIDAQTHRSVASQIADLILETALKNVLRHELLQDFMVCNDSATLAVEVPVVLYPDDLRAIARRFGLCFPQEALNAHVTGHIDILQVRHGCVHVLDYKPDARKVDATSQLMVYALALSERTGLDLHDFKCAWFDENDYFEFSPIEALRSQSRFVTRDRRAA